MKNRNPKVDAFVQRAKKWSSETQKLRSILLDCGLGEELKWGKPCYTFEESNLAIIQGFKDHCSLMFFKGSLLEDKHGVLVPPGPNSQAAMRIDFTGVEQIQKSKKIIEAYVKQAIAIEKAGLQVDFKQKRALELPEELAALLKQNRPLATAFRALTPGRQRAYVLYFSGAKQAKTRTARIEKHVKRILAGKGMDDR
ncbi:MAG: YdeI/OmpD-associated family protein [Myxococcales bacterium]|nr:YdeI/OmpD-associated family protein [Myxococcales bacterium]